MIFFSFNMKVKIITVVCLFLILANCKAIALKIISKKSVEKNIKILKRQSTNQTIFFFPTIHVGTEEYYNSFKPKLDSLRSNGYKIYYESVAITDSLSIQKEVDYKKKFRKIFGFHLDTTRQSYLEDTQLNKYIMQDYTKMGVVKSDEVLDLGVNQIIDSLENKYGEIILENCDIETPLETEYNCKNRLKDLEWDALQTFRNNYIINYLKKSNENKIVLIYGKSHWYFIYAKLLDSGYELVQGSI